MGVQLEITVENKNISVNLAQPSGDVVHSRNNYHANTIIIQPTEENRNLPNFYVLKKSPGKWRHWHTSRACKICNSRYRSLPCVHLQHSSSVR